MSYKTYTTKAIVCGSKDSYTSDRSFLLFTEDAGMLWATAKSVRMEKSKQRYALQDFSIIRVSLIKGKAGWRVGSVEAIANPFMEAVSREARTGVQSIFKLLRRFLHGEIPHPTIYEDAVFGLMCMTNADEGDIIDIQDQFALRMLHTLGYIAPEPIFSDILHATDPWSVPVPIPAAAHKAIERALLASHL